MDNEIRKYCEQCKFYSALGCQSTLICTNGNKFWAANVQPVKHGRWIPATADNLPYELSMLGIELSDIPKYAYCSECNFSFATNGKDKTGKALIHKAIYKYCPNCGARMDGEQNDD